MSVCFSPDDRVVAWADVETVTFAGIADEDRVVQRRRKNQRHVPAGGDSIAAPSLHWNAQQDWVVCAGGSSIEVFPPWGESTALPFDAQTNVVIAAAFSPNGDRLASADWEGTVTIWKTGTWAIIEQTNAGAQGVVWSPDGRRLMTTGYKRLRIFETTRLEQVLEIPVDDIRRQCAWTADGKRVVAHARDRLRVWDASRGYELAGTIYESIRQVKKWPLYP